MWFHGVRASRTAAAAAAASMSSTGSCNTMVRHFSRACAVNVRKINPKVPIQEAYSIARDLYGVIRNHGPLTIANTWNHAKEAEISGLQSKTHMKIMLKWMRGRKMLKLFCNHVGNSKKFLHCTLPEEPQNDKLKDQPASNVQSQKPSSKKKKKVK